NKKLLVRRDMQSHPALEKLYKDNRGQAVKEDEYEKFFIFVLIDRYVSVNQQQLRGGLGGGDNPLYKPNTTPLDNFNPPVIALTDRFQAIIDNPTPKNEKYIPVLRELRTELRKIAASTADLHVLSYALDVLLEYKGDDNPAAKRPGLIDFWAQQDNAALR